MLARCPQSSQNALGPWFAATSFACAAPSRPSAHPTPKLTIKTKNMQWSLENVQKFSKTCKHAIPNPWHAMQAFFSFEPRCLCMVTLQWCNLSWKAQRICLSKTNLFFWWNQVTRRCKPWLWSWSSAMLASLSNKASCWACASRSGWIANKMKLLQEHTSLLQQIFVQLWILATGKWRMIFFYGCVCFFYPQLSSIKLRGKCIKLRGKCRHFLSWRKNQ